MDLGIGMGQVLVCRLSGYVGEGIKDRKVDQLGD